MDFFFNLSEVVEPLDDEVGPPLRQPQAGVDQWARDRKLWNGSWVRKPVRTDTLSRRQSTAKLTSRQLTSRLDLLSTDFLSKLTSCQN
jgi:hypothetical protein